jgi:hypothetical protein
MIKGGCGEIIAATHDIGSTSYLILNDWRKLLPIPAGSIGFARSIDPAPPLPLNYP